MNDIWGEPGVGHYPVKVVAGLKVSARDEILKHGGFSLISSMRREWG